MSEANWPIRVGGEYPTTTVDGQRRRVIAIANGIVHYVYVYDDGDSTHRGSCGLNTFREVSLPEDQSPIPALVEALNDAKEWLGCYECGPLYAKVCAALAKAGQAASSVTEQSGAMEVR